MITATVTAIINGTVINDGNVRRKLVTYPKYLGIDKIAFSIVVIPCITV